MAPEIIYNLAWGTNELPELSPYWKKWLAKAQSDPIFQPAGFYGLEQLREAIIHRYESLYGLQAEVDNCTITNGGTEAIYTSLQWLASANGLAILHQPAWGYFEDCLRFLDIPYRTVQSTTEEGLTQELTPIRHDGPILFLLSNPSNPLTYCFSDQWLRTLSQWVGLKENHFVLSDEIYDWYVRHLPDYHSWTTIHGLNRSIIIHGYSKPTGLAAFRVGFYLAKAKLKNNLDEFHQRTTYGTASHSQFVATYAQKDEMQLTQTLRQEVAYRREIIFDIWNQSNTLVDPGHGMYVIVPLPSGIAETDILSTLASDFGIALSGTKSFGLAYDGLRINICRPKEVLVQALQGIGKALDRL